MLPESMEKLRETLVSMELENGRVNTELQHANALISGLEALLKVRDEDDPFSGVFTTLLPILDASHAIVLIQAPDAADELDCVAASQPDWAGARWRADGHLSKALNGRVVSTVPGQEAPADAPARQSGPALWGQPALYLPLNVRGQRSVFIFLRDAGASGFSRSDMNLARKFSTLVSHALAVRNARHVEVESQRLKELSDQLAESRNALAHRANHDPLTGLPNRTYVQELVSGMLAGRRVEEGLALAFIDLDGFKQVNDLHGHAVGDALLRGVANRMRGQIRAGDILGRISGDEFVLVLDSIPKRRETAALAERIREALRQPYDIEGAQIAITGSIGVAFFPAHGGDYETLKRNADTAMYHAKTINKGSIEFFRESMGRAKAQSLQLEQRLRAAFENRQFKCALQGKLALHGGLAGFEVLVRWVDDAGVIHAPLSFIGALDGIGLLDGMALMQIDELLGKLPELDARFGDDMIYSLNISADQATRFDFIKSIIRKIEDAGCANRFMFELTEESLLNVNVFQNRILPLIRAAGIRISIDDFGAGYSSLSLLADIEADELKIDRSFIAGIHKRGHNQSILRAVESLGRSFGMQLVAEGIETPCELKYLRDNTGIAFGQGYLFHRPAFIEDLMTQDFPAQASVQGG